MRPVRHTANEVMTRVARGMSVAGIAADLDITIGAVLECLWDHGDDDPEGEAGRTNGNHQPDPSPEQVRLRALAIRAGWSDEELKSREAGLRL